MIYGAKVMAAAAIKMIEEPEHLEKAKAEFDAYISKKPYKCPIPMDVPVPQPQK